MAMIFTEAAIAKARELVAAEYEPNSKVRVFISGGGCSGMQSGFTFDTVVNEDDTSYDFEGVTFLVDSMSFQYLSNATIDYADRLDRAGFVIDNPDIVATCGCGSSFAV